MDDLDMPDGTKLYALIGGYKENIKRDLLNISAFCK